MGTTADGPYSVWSPVEVTLHADERFENPYTDVAVTGTFEHESGTTHEVPGFWDGDSTWRVRFAPTEPGEWTWRTGSDVDGAGFAAEGEFVAAAYSGDNPIRRHGFLQVAEGGRHLEHADGTPFFWLGDTVWSAPAKATPEEWHAYLTKRRSQGFSVVQTNSLPQWDASKPQRRLPFGEHWGLDSPRPAYFQRLDEMMAETVEHGLVPALVVLWFNYVPDTNLDWDDQDRIARHPMSEAQAARYGRYLAARYGAYGATWLVSGDSDFTEESLAVYRAAGERLREGTTHPLSTLHIPGSQRIPEWVAEEPWYDFQMYQSGHHYGDMQRNAFRTAEYTRDVDPDRPVLNGEPCYEGWAYFEEPEVGISREDVRRAAWWSVLGGANAGITYGAPGLWHWFRFGEGLVRPEMPVPYELEEMVELPGADDYARMKSFLERFAFGALEPDQSLLGDHDETVRAARLPADDAVLVYTPTARALAVDLDGLDASRAAWFDPATGREVPASVDGDRIEAPPWRGDAVAVVR
jgi:hypothetical protein